MDLRLSMAQRLKTGSADVVSFTIPPSRRFEYGGPVPISETEMDTVQCGFVIDELHILASELGIRLREE